ncbi:MAG: SpoIIE family protein phosphatase [Luteitalea sp.]|nr:SpoIIE family protein phosphatase [Luteitalea sp.]
MSGPRRGTRELLDTFTQDVTADDLKRVFTRDAREAYAFFAHGIDRRALAQLPWPKRALLHLRLFLLAFSRRLPPARRALYGLALVCSLIGLVELYTGIDTVRIGPIVLPVLTWSQGTGGMFLALVLLNILFALEVADRLTLKQDLNVAREIQRAMLPRQPFIGLGVQAHGETRPANTVGGDFFDIVPTPDGRLLVALGDVAGKGTPAALLMALLLAILRTLVDEGLDAQALATRLNQQVLRHAPRSRFITALLGIYDPESHVLTYVNAGHPPALLRHANGSLERLPPSGMALGLDRRAVYSSRNVMLCPGDLLVVYSDGITEAESPSGAPFDDDGVDEAVTQHAAESAQVVTSALMARVEAHIADARVCDDLTILALRHN